MTHAALVNESCHTCEEVKIERHTYHDSRGGGHRWQERAKEATIDAGLLHMYVCMCVCVYFFYTYVHMYVRVCVFLLYVCMYICACVYIFSFRMYVCMCVCVY